MFTTPTQIRPQNRQAVAEIAGITPVVTVTGRRVRDDEDVAALPIARRQRGILDEFDVVEEEDNSSLQILNHGSAAVVLRDHGVFELSLASSLYNPGPGFPQGLVTSVQHNFAGMLFPMMGNKMFSMKSLMTPEGDYDGKKWKPFFLYRKKKGTTRNQVGGNTAGTFVWIDLALHTPKELIPPGEMFGHELMLDALHADTPEHELTTRQPDGRILLRCRVTSPFTADFERTVQGEAFNAIMAEGSIPIFFLLAVIIQWTPQGYIISTQDGGQKKSKVVLAGKIDAVTRQFRAL